MWTISETIGLLVMLAVSVRDIQIRKISIFALVAAGAGSIIYQITIGQTDWWLVLGGAAVGAVFVLISKVTGEGIGYGDSFGILVLGIYLGFWKILTVLSLSFFILLCVLIPILWKKRMSRKYTLPFYPFLTGGYLCLLLIEGIKI